MDAVDFLRLMLSADRLAVAGALARREATVDDLVGATGVDRRAVLETVAALVDGGLAARDAEGKYRLDDRALSALARDLPRPEPPASAVFYGMTDEERLVLGRFFRGDRLVEIPAQRSKRSIVLERIALEFEPGVRYSEREVNELLGRFHDDHVTLRRYLVDESLLDREGGEYWRAGGRVV